MLRKSQLTITFFILISTGSGILNAGSPIIGGYLFPAPNEVLQSVSIENAEPPVVGGIKFTYNGFSDYTNHDGYFSFPKHHPEQELRIVVCTETTYDLLQNTVSKIKVDTPKPELAVYKITKQQDTEAKKDPADPNKPNDPNKPADPNKPNDASKPTDPNKPATPPTPPATPAAAAKPAGANKSADANKDASKPADPNAKPDADTSSQASAADTPWCYTVTALGNTVPSDGIRSTDLIIHCDPSAIYIQTKFQDQNKTYYYDGQEENCHFIIPNECLYLIKTPPAPELDEADLMNESVEAETESDTVENKSSDTDSMGEKLPGVDRSAMADGQ